MLHAFIWSKHLCARPRVCDTLVYLFRHTFRDASKQRFVVARRRCCGGRVVASKASLSHKLWFCRVHGARRTKAIDVSTVAPSPFGIRRSARPGPTASLCTTLMLLPAIRDQWTVVVLRTTNRYLESAFGCTACTDAHHGTIFCSTLLPICTSSAYTVVFMLCSSFVCFSLSLDNTIHSVYFSNY